MVQGLCNSFVFVPIVSGGSVSGMAKRFEQAPDRVDYVLLEWMLALELHERGRMLRIYPLFMGEWKQPSASASSGTGPRMLGFDRDTQLARVPDEVSEPTWSRLCELASRFPLIPGEPRRRTAREVARGPVLLGVAALLRAQGAHPSELQAWACERAVLLNGGDAMLKEAVALLRTLALQLAPGLSCRPLL